MLSKTCWPMFEKVSDSDELGLSTRRHSTFHTLPWASIDKRMSVIAADSLFHLYNYSDQFKLARRVVQLLAPERGSLILGRQVGSSVPGEYTAVDNKGSRYSHDVASFRRFGDQVAAGFGDGCSFRVEATLDEEELGENKSQDQTFEDCGLAFGGSEEHNLVIFLISGYRYAIITN